MKHPAVLCAVFVVLSINTVFAANTHHEHHQDAHTVELELNAGKKWETDAPLRQSMNELRQAMTKEHPSIHENRLPLETYNALAKTIEAQVSNIVAQCKLPPAADKQLHIIVAMLMTGAGQMSDKESGDKARQGAIKVFNALNLYGQYFDDPAFHAIAK